MVKTILANLIIFVAVNSSANTPNAISSKDTDLALETAKSYTLMAKRIAALKQEEVKKSAPTIPSLIVDSLHSIQKGAYCALSAFAADMRDVSSLVFGREYTRKADEIQKLKIEESLRNNISDLFLEKIAPVFNSKNEFLWDEATVTYTDALRRGNDRVPGFVVSFQTYNSESKNYTKVEYQLAVSQEDPSRLVLVDLVLGVIRVSKLFGSYKDEIRLDKTMEDVLNDWSSIYSPCPNNLDPYYELLK